MKNTLFEPVIKIKGVGPKIEKKLIEKKIENKIDLLLNLPTGIIDRRFCPTLDQLEIGKITTVFITPIKYSFPRIRNLPSRVTCADKYSKIDLVFFNSRENYIKQALPLNEEELSQFEALLDFSDKRLTDFFVMNKNDNDLEQINLVKKIKNFIINKE